MIRIQVTVDNKVLGDKVSEQPECFLGTDSESLVPLRGWRIGRRQMQFSLREDGIFVRDGGGVSPIKVNGNAVNEYGPLASTDLLELHIYKIKVQLTEAAFQHTAKAAPLVLIKEAGPASADEAPIENPLETQDGIALRSLLHKKLIAAMDLRRVNVSRMGDAELRSSVQKIIEEIIDSDPAFMGVRTIADQLRDVVLNEVVGLGPLEALLADDAVTELMVNRYNDIFVERNGQLTRSEISFSNDAAVMAAIERIVSPLGRRIDESSPMVDARLKDGSRVNAIIPPLAIKGPCITIRKFSKNKLTDRDLVKFGSISHEMTQFLKVAVELRANVVISGGTGSGKTTLLNVLSNFIPDDERIVTVEDAAELQLSQPNLVSLEARPANIEGRGAVTIRDLVKNCLRMRPDRIVVGECRGGEALDMLQAMNTGHDGSLTTAHANSPRDCLSRLEVMTLMSGLDIPIQAIREQICSAVNLIVQQTRFSCGTRRVTYITEVTGIENNIITMQDIFRFHQEGFGPDGKVRGYFAPTGHIPDFYQELIRRGIPVDVGIFSRGAPPQNPSVKRVV
jgi:pilus assembly protein CpaF